MVKAWASLTLGFLTVISILLVRLSSQTIELIGWIIGSIIILAFGGTLLILGAFSFQKYRLIKARADKEALEASIIESAGDKWVRENINGSIEYARLGGIRLRVNGHDHKPTESEILYATTQQTTGQTKLLTGPLSQIVPSAPLDLLPLLDKAERVLIKGASDAGKTELLRHIATRSRGVIVIDPHFTPGIWPQCQIIGAGRNYAQIDKFLQRLMMELDERYQRRAKGDNNFKPITVIIDEFQSVKEECTHAGKILSTLIRESRKVGFRLFIGSHSDRVLALGLEGQGDIRDGLLRVKLGIDQITKQRTCKVDDGNGERDCYFPPYNMALAPSIVGVTTPDLVIKADEDLAIVEKQSADDRFVELVHSGISRNEASLKAYGRAYGGNLVARGKAALGE